MFQTSYLREVRKEKYQRSDVFEEEPSGREPSGPEESAGASAIQGWENLQDLNSRFARYINRARVLEQSNAVFRKQLETLQRMEESGGLEEAFTQQISLNRRRLRELSADHAKLSRELSDACRMLDEYTNKYRNEFECQEQLRGTLEQLNKEADATLLMNLEYQIQSQFLQDDINSTKERHKKNLSEIQTYVNILHQINHSIPLMPNMAVGISEEQEKLLAQRKVPGLRVQLEEYKGALCRLQAQKQRLHSETSVLEQSIRSTQQSYDAEIQRANEQMDSLRREIEEAERALEKLTSESRHLSMYQTSLENELERYKRIIENEDNRLNSAIIGTPITLFTTNYRYTHTPSAPSRGKDITQAMQDITSIKPRQKNLAKKVLKKREVPSTDVRDSGPEERAGEGAELEEENEERREETGANGTQRRPVCVAGVAPQDVPDGAQISKAFDTLCNIVRDRMRKYRSRPEPIADFYTKGRYVLVSGDGSYLDPCFYTSTPSAGHVYVTIRDGPYGPPDTPLPTPTPGPAPLDPTPPSDGEGGGAKGDKGGKGKDGGGGGGKGKHRNGDPHTRPKDPGPAPQPQPAPGPDPAPGPTPPHHGASGRGPACMSYEKLEVVESVEKFSNDRKTTGYEETAMVVETMIEKTSKKKH